MTSLPIGYLRDGFDLASAAPTWATSTTGSATLSQSSSQAVFTLPSSTAGSHAAYYQSVQAYDFTSDGFTTTIGTMVATGVVASAFLLVIYDLSNYVQWIQSNNTIKVQKVIAGVVTDLFSATWSSTNHKHLRIRESGGTMFFDSSTAGVSWTNRASLANPFAVTALSVRFGASCGNVASPGSFKLDDINLITGLATNWHFTQCERPSTYFCRTITVAATSGQGCIMTCEAIDASLNPVAPRYFAGPLGSANGNYNQLVEHTSLANAQANAVNLPIGTSGRWDLPEMVNHRVERLYHRSTTGSSYGIAEYYPRRLVQSDDIEAESIKAINIAANAITADKISVLNLAAINANIGQLNIDTTGWIYQGTGTGSAPTTGLKLFNSGGIGKLSTYNSGVEQVTLDTDGKLKAGAGAVQLDAGGISIDLPAAQAGLQAYQFTSGGVLKSAVYGYLSGVVNAMQFQVEPLTTVESQLNVFADGGTSHGAAVFLRATGNNGSKTSSIEIDASSAQATISIIAANGTTVNGPLLTTDSISPPRSSGSAVFALDGTSKGSALTVANTVNATVFSNARVFSGLILISETAVSGSAAVFLVDGGGSIILISQTGSNYSTAIGTASKTNVYLATGVVTLENRLGSTATYNIMALRTRTS